jgi:signal transduction histidine kinase
MSRELHDTAARGMVALIWQIEGVKSIAKKSNFDALLANLDEASDLARENVREIRRAVRALRSTAFHFDGCLASALQKALNEAANGAGLQTEVKVSGAPYSISRTWEEALLRITQESLTNTLKYAEASRFDVELCFCPGEFRLRLRDDGIGFDYQPGYSKPVAHETWFGGGLGLLGIQERVRQLGGRIRIESNANHGTTIQITVPRQPRFCRWFTAISPQ